MSARPQPSSSLFAILTSRVFVIILLISLTTLDTVAQGNNGLWTSISPSPFASAGPSATLLGDNTVLLAGGTNGFDAFANRIASSALFIPATNDWLPLPPMGTARSYHGASIMPNGKVLVAGGYATVPPLRADLGGDPTSPCGPGEGIATSGIASGGAEIFDETMLTWTPASPMNSARAEFSLVRMFNGMVLAAGGSGDSTAEFYNPATDTWTYTSSMQNFHLGAATTLLPDGRVFVGGGNIGSLLFGLGSCSTSAEVYDPVADTWTSTGGMSKNRYHATATVVRLGDGSWRVLVVGGADGNDPNLPSLATAELWDPSTNNFTPAASMATPRQFESASVLPSGEVLVAGGFNQPTGVPPVQSSAEIYDPVRDTWRSGSAMTTARNSQTSTLFSTFPPKVLVAGGFSGANFLSGAEIFQPTPIASSTTVALESLLPGTSTVNACLPGAVEAFVGSSTGLGVPTGSMSFYENGSLLFGPTPLSGGIAALSAELPSGGFFLEAKYFGDSAFSGSNQTIQVVAEPPPIQVTGPTYASLGVPVTLTASVPAGAVPPYSFTWIVPGGSFVPGSSLTVTPPLGTNAYTVEGSDANHCGFGLGSFTLNVLPAGVNLIAQVNQLFRDSTGNIGAVIDVTNQAGDTAGNVQVTASSLNSIATTSALPIMLGNISPGPGTAFVTVYTGTSATPGSLAILRLSFTFTNIRTGVAGNAGATLRVTAP